MRPSVDYVKLREEYLTTNYRRRLMLDAGGMPNTVKDYFTDSEEFPRTFRIGKCVASNADNVKIQVQLYWRDDAQTVQSEVLADVIRADDSWRIDNVSQKY